MFFRTVTPIRALARIGLDAVNNFVGLQKKSSTVEKLQTT
jgi:hypothetical protein